MWPVLLKQPRRVPVRARLTPHRRFVALAGPTWSIPRLPGGLHAGEPETCRRDWHAFALVLLHLGLLLAVVRVFRIEGRGFQHLVTITLAALPVHYLAPFRWKKPVFIGASVAALYGVFGTEISAWLLAGSALLLAACLVPVRWGARVALVAALALALALARGGALPLPVPEAVWPLLGSFFMFRMIILLYEMKHAERPEHPIDVINYFLLLPNACFLHFPVVDYRTLRRGYFAVDIHVAQRRGLDMMTKGTTHLLLYRLIYQRLLISPAEVHDLATLAGYLVANYLLYLRVSGQFHIACGLLHLFGYQLPETHHHYLLATGFTDYWRRINIYWKDFMVRLVFNPVVFRLKRRPRALALGLATLAVFVVTWALHAYQSFWLRGAWGLSVPDALFWGALGALVLVNVWNDARSPRTRAPRRHTVRAVLVRALKIAGTFTTLALLWSLWSSPTLAAWLAMLARAFGSNH